MNAWIAFPVAACAGRAARKARIAQFRSARISGIPCEIVGKGGIGACLKLFRQWYPCFLPDALPVCPREVVLRTGRRNRQSADPALGPCHGRVLLGVGYLPTRRCGAGDQCRRNDRIDLSLIRAQRRRDHRQPATRATPGIAESGNAQLCQCIPSAGGT